MAVTHTYLLTSGSWNINQFISFSFQSTSSFSYLSVPRREGLRIIFHISFQVIKTEIDNFPLFYVYIRHNTYLRIFYSFSIYGLNDIFHKAQNIFL